MADDKGATPRGHSMLDCLANRFNEREMERRGKATALLVQTLEQGDAIVRSLGESDTSHYAAALQLARANHDALVLLAREFAFRRDNGNSGMLMFPGLSDYIDRRFV